MSLKIIFVKVESSKNLLSETAISLSPTPYQVQSDSQILSNTRFVPSQIAFINCVCLSCQSLSSCLKNCFQRVPDGSISVLDLSMLVEGHLCAAQKALRPSNYANGSAIDWFSIHLICQRLKVRVSTIPAAQLRVLSLALHRLSPRGFSTGRQVSPTQDSRRSHCTIAQ